MSNRKYLVADIGGTNSRFARFEESGSGLSMIDSVWLKTTEADSTSKLLKHFSKTDLGSLEYDVVVVAAAGPVTDDTYCDPPNISFSIHRDELIKELGVNKAYLINDFLAQSYAVDTHVGLEAMSIKDAPTDHGMIAVLGPGTGLGKAMLYKGDASKVVGYPSEGGHAAFPVESQEEFSFLEFACRKLKEPYLSWEQAINGRSITLLFEHLYKESLGVKEVASKIKEGECPELVRMYSKFLARACRCFALEVFSEGGVVIAGGVINKTPELLDKELFTKEFCNSSTQRNFLEKVRVSLLTDQESGLWGAARFGQIRMM